MGLFHRKPKARARDEPPQRRTLRWVERTAMDWQITNSEFVFAATSLLANTLGALPIHLYRGAEIQGGHDLERLIAYAPNPNMTAFTFRQTMEACRNGGNAYALIVPGEADRPCALDVLKPERVTPQLDLDTNELWFDISLDNGAVATIHNSRMIALRHMSTTGYRGIKPMDVLRGTLDYEQEIRTFNAKSLAGFSSGIILKYPDSGLDDGRKQQIEEQFLNMYTRSRGNVVVLEGGVEAIPVEKSPVDSRVFEASKDTRNRVSTVFSIPPHMMGDYSDTSYSTAEQSMLEYLELTIHPITQQWVAELNRKLLTWKMVQEGYTFGFDLSLLHRADTQVTADKYQKAVRSAWMTPNEIRAQEFLGPRPEGDELMISKDMVPVRLLEKLYEEGKMGGETKP